jgi:hypothetical protein
MRNGAVRLLLAWVFLTAVNSAFGLSIASRITTRLNEMFFQLASVFLGLHLTR